MTKRWTFSNRLRYRPKDMPELISPDRALLQIARLSCSGSTGVLLEKRRKNPACRCLEPAALFVDLGGQSGMNLYRARPLVWRRSCTGLGNTPTPASDGLTPAQQAWC